MNEEYLGTIKISEEVIKKISAIAAAKVEGIYSMGGSVREEIAGFLGFADMSKGVNVDMQEQEVEISLNVVIKYGYRVPDVSYLVQKSVKKQVEELTGLYVKAVNINVQSIYFEKKEEEKEVETNREGGETDELGGEILNADI